MRRESEFFGDAELHLLYMASRLRDSLKLEEVLNEAGIDYLVETGTYTGGVLLRRDLTGAFFYVLPDAIEPARQVLLNHRFKPYRSD
jgi:hypothetical protein